MVDINKKKKPFIHLFLFEYSGFLLAGSLIALIWANVDPGAEGHPSSYRRFVDFELKHLFDGELNGSHAAYAEEIHEQSASHAHREHSSDEVHTVSAENHDVENHDVENHDAEDHDAEDHDAENHDAENHDDHSLQGIAQSGSVGGHHGHTFDLEFLVNDVLMALFFAIAAKEVLEALLPGGALSNRRKAATPLLATVGGVVGPALIYFGGAMLLGQTKELGNGWAVPCATDIAFSYLVARLIFGAGHPAIAFLLLLAIADDAAGLIILAVFYPDPNMPPNYWWLLLTLASMALCFGFRRMRLHSFWFYLLIPGALCWYSFFKAGIHPALGLVPIIACMPHAHTDLGIFARKEKGRHDTLNEFEHWWKNPIEVILGLFGLVNAGVILSSMGAGTALVLAGLLVGKPVGITLFTWLGQKLFKLELPNGMNYRHVVTLGMIAGIGFTVALFVSVAAFKGADPLVIDSVKMGALLSFGAAGLAFAIARVLGIRPITPQEAPE